MFHRSSRRSNRAFTQPEINTFTPRNEAHAFRVRPWQTLFHERRPRAAVHDFDSILRESIFSTLKGIDVTILSILEGPGKLCSRTRTKNIRMRKKLIRFGSLESIIFWLRRDVSIRGKKKKKNLFMKLFLDGIMSRTLVSGEHGHTGCDTNSNE